MVDPRYEAARMTDQSGGRGWDFSPAAPTGFRPSFVMVVLAVVAVAASLIGLVTQ